MRSFPAFLPLSGRLADRYGHRFLFLLGLAVFTAASAACALAPSVWTLVGARVVQAVGAAFVVPTSLSLILAAYPPERRSYAVGVWAVAGASVRLRRRTRRWAPRGPAWSGRCRGAGRPRPPRPGEHRLPGV